MPSTDRTGRVTRAEEWFDDEHGTRQLARIPGIQPGSRMLRRQVKDGVLTVILSRDPLGAQWHLSISHPTRHPTWDEISEARYTLLPDAITVALLLPPRREYVNVHEHCFHLHEIRERVPNA